MENIVIHIGYHKSASTFLQKNVFPNLPVNYIFLSGEQREILDLVESVDGFDLDVLRKWVRNKIEAQYCNDIRKTTVISHEELSGHPMGYNIVNPFATASNLKKAFPDAKILIVIRNQMDYLKSIYSFRVAIKGQEHRCFDQFLKEECKKGILDHLIYYRLILNYMRLFGRDNILVMPMEYLKLCQEGFIKKISDFIKVECNSTLRFRPVNVSTTYLGVISFWRPINHAFQNLLILFLMASGKDSGDFKPEVFKGYYPFSRFRYAFYGFKMRMTGLLNSLCIGTERLKIKDKLIEKQLKRNLENSNLILQNLLDMDLKKLGYPSKYS